MDCIFWPFKCVYRFFSSFIGLIVKKSTQKRHRRVHCLRTLACHARAKVLTTNPIVCGTMRHLDILSLGGSCGHFCVSDIFGTVAPDLHYNAIYLNSKGKLFEEHRRLNITYIKDLVKELSSGRIFIQSCPKEFCKCSGYIFWRNSHVPTLQFQAEDTSIICDTETEAVLTMTPSVSKVQEIYLNAANNISGLCGMMVEMHFPKSKHFNHGFNLWPKLNRKGKTVFKLRHFSFKRDSLNYYFSGAIHNCVNSANRTETGYYLFHFIVDTKKRLATDSS